jgi:hypothetical protein
MLDSARCVSCGAGLPPGFGSCAEVFAAVCAREYTDPAYGAVHLLSVDAHALQHSEDHGPRSNAFHLMRLCHLLERGGDPRLGSGPSRARAKAFEGDYRQFPFLEPPAHRGEITVGDVFEDRGPDDHAERVRQWACSVWEAWEPHHDWAREMAGRYLGERPDRAR